MSVCEEGSTSGNTGVRSHPLVTLGLCIDYVIYGLVERNTCVCEGKIVRSLLD
jgi:hypothetical protein